MTRENLDNNAEKQNEMEITEEMNKEKSVLPNDQNSVSSDLELKQLRGLLNYYQDALKFSNQIQNAAPKIFALLSSTTKSEVIAAMKFVVVAHEFGMECSKEGVLKMIHKIWDKDTTDKESGSIREHLVQTFHEIYFNPIDPSPETVCSLMIEFIYFLTYYLG